jgi:hypothetical protein
MTPVTSRRLRRTGLLLVAIGFVNILAPLPLQARFGHEFDWLLPPPWLFFALVMGWWMGIILYLVGRFQYRP